MKKKEKDEGEDILTQSGLQSSTLVPVENHLWKQRLKGCVCPLIGCRISPSPLAGMIVD